MPQRITADQQVYPNIVFQAYHYGTVTRKGRPAEIYVLARFDCMHRQQAHRDAIDAVMLDGATLVEQYHIESGSLYHYTRNENGALHVEADWF